MRKSLFILTLILLGTSLFSQSRIDSLKTVLKNARGANKISVLHKLENMFLDIYAEKSIEYGKAALSESKKIRNTNLEIISLNNLAYSYLVNGDNINSDKFYKKSLKLAEEIDFKQMVVKNYSDIGDLYLAGGNSDKAFEYYLKSLRKSKVAMHEPGIAENYKKIADIYFLTKDYQNAADRYNRAGESYAKLGDTAGLGRVIFKTGEMNYFKPDYEAALENFFEALRYFQEINLKPEIIETYNYLGLCYMKLGNLKQSKKHVKIADELSHELSKEQIFSKLLHEYEFYHALGEEYKALESYDKYVNLMNLKQENVRISEQQAEFEKVREEVAEDKKRTDKALSKAQREKAKTLFQLRTQELVTQTKDVQIDSLEQINVAKSRKLLQIEHENLTKLREIENLEHLKEVQKLELEKQQNIIYMIGAGVLLALLFAGFFFRLYRTKRQLNLELEAAYYELERIATKDPLTNLSNRRDMLEKIEAEIKRFERTQRPFTVIISDIDHFKNINDNYGHDGGDFILKLISDLFRETIRKQDIVARWGGEEFLFVLPETDISGGNIIAGKIRGKIEEYEFNFNNQKIPVTMTFGVSAYYHTEDIDETIKRADTALYKGKNSGRNKVVLYSDV